MADDRIKILEERLTRIEAAISQRPSAVSHIPGGGVVDPAAFAASQLQFARPMPSPVVDPAPWPYGGWGAWGRPRWPYPIVDPLPFPHPVVDPAPWPSPVVDPAVFSQSLAAALGRIRPVGGDPPPPDLSRLSIQQLEATIHTISAERARLDAMEAMVNKQIETLKKQQPNQ